MSPKPFKIFNVVGARPNMMKMAPVVAEMRRHPDLVSALVHTGQHYDIRMSEVFLKQLDLGEPDHNLNVGSGTHHHQTAQILEKFGDLVVAERPDMIVVAGDVNSTMACALVGAKERIPVAHVEAGLRSFDRGMPEEINRIVADGLSDLLFTTEESGSKNLIREGVSPEKIRFAGNAMIDSLVSGLEAARSSPILEQLALRTGRFILATLHRPSNVDQPENLQAFLKALREIAKGLPIVFPIHPRTEARITSLEIEGIKRWDGSPSGIGTNGIWLIPPASYMEFLCLMDASMMVITDSGGIQEETSYLGIPCLTYRDNTERPVTVLLGTNRLVGANPYTLIREAANVLHEPIARRKSSIPLWDGQAGKRIVAAIIDFLNERQGSTKVRTDDMSGDRRI